MDSSVFRCYFFFHRSSLGLSPASIVEQCSSHIYVVEPIVVVSVLKTTDFFFFFSKQYSMASLYIAFILYCIR